MVDTLPTAVSDEAHRREHMEAVLRNEIYFAVHEYPTFAEEFLTIPEERQESITSRLSSEALFSHGGKPWSIDCSTLEGAEDTRMQHTVAKILDTISLATSRPDQFRPTRRDIEPLKSNVRVDDPNDFSTRPDIIQGTPLRDAVGTYHWGDVEFFAECKGSKSGASMEDQMSEALLQLACYARATFVHQIYRRYVFSIAVCNTTAVFVRFGRTGILHSPTFDLRENFKEFALAAAGLFAMDADSFGYDTRFRFRSPQTALPDPTDAERRLQVEADGKWWFVYETICQRKCLVGRATLVLRLRLATDRTQRAVLKFIWRDVSRTDEGANLETFKGDPGICQCKWSTSGHSTAIKHKETLSSSRFMKSFYLPLPETEVNQIRSSVSNPSNPRALSSATAHAKYKQHRTSPPEDRVQSVILMDEGLPLWQIQRLPHLLKVLRDGLVGLAAIAEHGKVHRDVSEGNILCRSLHVPSTDGCSEEVNISPLVLEDSSDTGMKASGAREDFDSDSDTTGANDGSDLHSGSSSDTSVDELNDPPLDPEDGITTAETYKEYVQQRYNGRDCDGRLYDLEFMVKQDRPDDEVRGMERTGTPAFISAQLLLATNDEPVKHTFLHDLESFFWVLIWMVASHVEPGAQLTEEASGLIGDLCDANERSLGLFKGFFISRPAAAARKIMGLKNGWEQVGDVVYKFAEFLKQEIYNKAEPQAYFSDDGSLLLADKADSGDVEPWPVIKSVISIFDAQISKLVKP